MSFLNKLFGSAKKGDQKHTHITSKPEGIDLSKVYPRIKGISQPKIQILLQPAQL